MIPKQNPQCIDCKTPTKAVVAFADGYDDKGNHVGTSIFTCENMACPIRQAHAQAEKDEADRKEAVAQMNREAGHDFSRVEAVRKANRVILGDAAAMLGISPVEYCKYRGNEIPVPVDVWERCLMLLAVYEGGDKDE